MKERLRLGTQALGAAQRRGLSLKAAKVPGQRHAWRFDYSSGNKRQALSLGGYPFVGLEEVRALASQVRQPLGVAEGVLTADLCRDLRGALKKPSAKHFELALVIHTSQRWSPLLDSGSRELSCRELAHLPVHLGEPFRQEVQKSSHSWWQVFA